MSFASKVTFGVAITFTSSVIAYVHLKQKQDRESLREGVIKDLQRQHMKRTLNIKAQQDQMELTKVLRAQRDAELETDRKGGDNPR